MFRTLEVDIQVDVAVIQIEYRGLSILVHLHILTTRLLLAQYLQQVIVRQITLFGRSDILFIHLGLWPSLYFTSIIHRLIRVRLQVRLTQPHWTNFWRHRDQSILLLNRGCLRDRLTLCDGVHLCLRCWSGLSVKLMRLWIAQLRWNVMTLSGQWTTFRRLFNRQGSL